MDPPVGPLPGRFNKKNKLITDATISSKNTVMKKTQQKATIDVEILYETSESIPGSGTSRITNTKASGGTDKGMTKGISGRQNEIELKSSDTGGGGNAKMFMQQLLLQQNQMQHIMVELATIKKEKKQMESFDGGGCRAK